ncbi:MAG TPA: GAF domain-containing protein, partial [Anaerolineae bacterium]|nr:GAF domain-containing protein [Anaerolineae bacterium]
GQWLLVGFDLEPATLEAIREGIVQVTIGQHPYLQAYLPILALVEHLYLDKSLEGWIAEGWLPNPLLTETQAEVAVPIALRDQVLGVLDVQHNVAGSLKPENANLLRSVADQVAIALQNAHLLTQTQAVLAEMQQSQELLRTTIDATPDWIFIKDRNHRYRLVNQGYANSLHMAPEDFIGKNDLEIGFPEEIVKGNPDKGIRGFWADDLEVMESGQSKFIEVEPAFVDGRPIFLSTIKTPLRDSSGNVWGVLGFVRDITQREQLLAEAENLYKAGRQISEAKDLQEIVTAVAEARLVAIINRVLLFTFERNSLDEVEAMTVVANWHSGQGMLPSPLGRSYGRDAFSTVELMLNPDPLFFNDVQHDERMDAPIIAVAQQQNIRAMAVIPLQLGGRQLGVLLLQAEEVHEFTPREIQFYLSLAPQIAVAIDNQRLLAETRTALAEVEQTQRRYTLQTWETYRDKLTTLDYEQVREGVTPLGDNLLPEIIQTVDQQRRLRAS